MTKRAKRKKGVATYDTIKRGAEPAALRKSRLARAAASKDRQIAISRAENIDAEYAAIVR